MTREPLAATSSRRPVQMVLVPGFWLGAWAWDDVVGQLSAAGVVPHPVTLPGLGPDDTTDDRSHVTRDDHVRAVTDLVETLEGPVVLVGHSGGGALVGEVVDRVPGRVAHVVYLDSGPLVDGARLTEPAFVDGPEVPLPSWDELAAQGSSTAGLDDAVLARFRDLARPQPAAVATTPVRTSDPARLDVPATALCTSIPSDQLRALASPDAPFHTELLDLHRLEWVDLPTGHWAMLSRPDDLATALAAIAHAVAHTAATEDAAATGDAGGASSASSDRAARVAVLHRQALDDASTVVHGLTDDDLAAPSRCAGWSVRDLVEHMTGQNVGFGTAISEGDAPVEAYRPLPVDAWDASARALTAAVAAPADEIRLAEVRPDERFDLATVLSMHTLDLAVHAWDAAGDAYRPSDELVSLVLAAAQRVPTERPPGAAFGPVVTTDADGPTPDDPWRRALRLLGREP